MALISRKAKTTLANVYASLHVSGKNVSGTIGGISFDGDGKQVLPYRELGYYLAGKSTTFCASVVKDVLHTTIKLTLPSFDHVEAHGASKEKDDVTLFSHDIRVLGFSCKYNNSASERSQAPSWDSVEAFYGKFVDIQPMKSYFEEQAAQFTRPALRNSRTKGDYTPALRARCDQMHDAVQHIEQYVAKIILVKNDVRGFAQGLLETFIGETDAITFVDFKTRKIFVIDRLMLNELARRIRNGELTYKQSRSDAGNTRHTFIYLNGNELMHFQTTASCDAQPGQKNRDLRRAKRQTYVTVTI